MLARQNILFLGILAINLIVSYMYFFNIFIFGHSDNAVIIVFVLFIIVVILDIIMIFIIKKKKVYYLIIILIPLMVLVLGKFSINTRIAFKYGLQKSKNKLEKITNENKIYSDVYSYKSIYLFNHIKNKKIWLVYAYDYTGYFENMGEYEENEKNSLLIHDDIEILGYKLIAVRKLESNWYHCVLITEDKENKCWNVA